MGRKMTYREAGVNIENADAAKTEMAAVMAYEDRRVIHKPGAFASLFLTDFPGIEHPVLVMKAEEPGSKQILAFKYGRVKNICFDLIHHLVNDVIVMGAKPEVVLDTILCGKIEREIAVNIVKYLSEACQAQQCSLIGGETSEQPGVLNEGQYLLNASIVAVVDRDKIIDGHKIEEGDTVLAIASNGLHTNGYSLVRKLIEDSPEILQQTIEGESFLDAILRPHKCYYQPLKDLFPRTDIHGLAHITGGGIAGNLKRILPVGTSAQVDLSKLNILPIFRTIHAAGAVPEEDMLQTFNLGIGLILVANPATIPHIKEHLRQFACASYEIGEIVRGSQEVEFINRLSL